MCSLTHEVKANQNMDTLLSWVTQQKISCWSNQKYLLKALDKSFVLFFNVKDFKTFLLELKP